MMFAGHGADRVLQRIAERRCGQRAGRLGLVIEGGAMRGMRSAGGLCALERLGLSDAFDSVFATSSGAVNAAYFLARQAVYGSTIYPENLNGREFINALRFGKFVDVDYAIDRVVKELKPLDVTALQQTRAKFHACVLDVDSAEGFTVDALDGVHPVTEVLRATCAMPILYNRPVMLSRRRCIDGGWWDHLPIQIAIDHGCTDVLVFLTQPADFLEKSPGLFERAVFQLYGHGGNAPLWQAYLTAARRTNASREMALGKTPLPRPINIATFAPTRGDTHLTSRTTDPGRLRAAADEYAAAVTDKLRQVLPGECGC
jgi:predicted patatin/cPLA2 family phospholipase